MKINRKAIGIVFVDGVMIVSGVVMSYFCLFGLVNLPATFDFLEKTKILPVVFFYYHLPEYSIKAILCIRLSLAILQIVAGAMFWKTKCRKWSLYSFRFLTLFGIISAFINPFYADIVVILAIFGYVPFLYILYHPRTKELVLNEFYRNTPEPLHPTLSVLEEEGKSRGVTIISIIEILIALGWLRMALWVIPISGLSLDLSTRFPVLSFSIAISKVSALSTLIAVLAAGILTLTFNPIGRLLTMFFSLACLLMSSSVFLVDYSKTGLNQPLNFLYGIFIVVCSYIGWFLLKHPKVRGHFTQISQVNIFKKLLSAAAIIIFYFVIVWALHYAVHRFSSIFENTEIKQVAVKVNTNPATSNAKWQELSEKFLYLYKNQHYAEAEEIGKATLKLAQEAFGPEHDNVAVSLNNLSLLYVAEKKYKEAESLLERVLSINEKNLGGNDPKVATDLNNLAEAYKAQKKFTDAAFLYNRALKICEKAYGANHRQTKIARENLEVLQKEKEGYENSQNRTSQPQETRPLNSGQ